MSNVENTTALSSGTLPAPRDLIGSALAVPQNAIFEGVGMTAIDLMDQWQEAHDQMEAFKVQSEGVRDAATSLITDTLLKALEIHQPAVELLIACVSSKDNEGAKARQQAMNDISKRMLGMVVEQKNPNGKVEFVETQKVKDKFGIGATTGTEAHTKGLERRRNFATFIRKAQEQVLGILSKGFTGKDTRIDPKTKLLQLTGPKVADVFGINRDSITIDGKVPDGIKHNLKNDNSLKSFREAALAEYGKKAPETAPVTTTDGATVAKSSNVAADLHTVVTNAGILLNAYEDVERVPDTDHALVAFAKRLDEFFVARREKDNLIAEATKRQAQPAAAKAKNGKPGAKDAK